MPYKRTRALLVDMVRFGFLIIACIVFVFPIYWLISTSVKPFNELIAFPPELVPRQITFSSYLNVLTSKTILFNRYFLNSVIVATSTTFIVIFLASLGGYSLSRLKFPGRNILASLILFIYTVPRVFLMIPIYMTFAQLKILNTHLCLIWAYTTFSLPFCLWLLKGFFDEIPRELEDSARVDGCTRIGALFRVVFPLCAPGIATAAMFSFVLCWNEFMFANTFVKTNLARTLPVGLYLYIGEFTTSWGEMLAAATLTTIPVLILFIFLQKYLVSGLTAGAVKG